MVNKKGKSYAKHFAEVQNSIRLSMLLYRDCVLKAVNLGGDTDTVAAVAGGLAGALYGYEGIPQEWRETLIKREWIEEMCARAGKAWSGTS